MNVYDNRLKTFVENPWPLQTQKEAKYSIEHFSAAGFFFSPTPEHLDATSCYLCKKDLDGWEPDDNPWLAHIKHGRMDRKIMVRHFSAFLLKGKFPESIRNSSALILSELRSGPEEVPCPLVTMYLERSRIYSFCTDWPHPTSGLNAHKATPFSLANSGFFFYPSVDTADQVICYQCGLVLNEWECDDDPWLEHKKRRPDCLHVQGKPSEPYAFTAIFNTCSPLISPSKINTTTYLPRDNAGTSLRELHVATTPLVLKEPVVKTSKQLKSKRSSIFSQSAQTTPVPTSRIKEIIMETKDTRRSNAISDKQIDRVVQDKHINIRKSGPITPPLCSPEEFEAIASMTVGAYVDWIGQEIISAFDRIANDSSN